MEAAGSFAPTTWYKRIGVSVSVERASIPETPRAVNNC
jgi:hypothetical protein